MSQQTLPTMIDFIKLADHRTRLQGQLPVASMPRLQDLIADQEGEVALQANFDRDPSGTPFLELLVETYLMLKCQRCLENFTYPLVTKVLLSPIYDDQLEKKMENYEPLLMTKDELVSLPQMVEDEILLNLPLVPKHPKNVCPMVLSSQETTMAESPFAVLSKLKIKKEE